MDWVGCIYTFKNTHTHKHTHATTIKKKEGYEVGREQGRDWSDEGGNNYIEISEYI